MKVPILVDDDGNCFIPVGFRMGLAFPERVCVEVPDEVVKRWIEITEKYIEVEEEMKKYKGVE